VTATTPPTSDYDIAIRFFGRLRGITIEDVAAGLSLPFREVAAMVDEALRRGDLIERPQARNATGRPCELLLAETSPAPMDIRDVLSAPEIAVLRELMSRRRPVSWAELMTLANAEGLTPDLLLRGLAARLAPFGVDAYPRYGIPHLGEESRAIVTRVFGERW
jgi:hypothetical protein